MKGLRDLGKKFDWFRCKKISQKLKYLSFKCEQSERYFCPILLVSPFCACPMRKIRCLSGNQPYQPLNYLAVPKELKIATFISIWPVVKILIGNGSLTLEQCKIETRLQIGDMQSKH